MVPSTTTRTGLTLRLTSSPRLCALTQTHPATSWVCSESMFSRQYNRLVPSFLCKRERNYGHTIITENDVINVKKSLFFSDTLSVVASEHRPFGTKQRALGKDDFTKIPHGVAGVQDRMSVIWERGVVSTSTVLYHMIRW